MNPVVKAIVSSSRLSAGQLLARRAISTTRPRLAASVFKMPAMSPTMEEGGIVDWKVKEGDSFSAGDVLLEIETDKAQIDVEAQDDGVLAKIFEQNGAKGIKVGANIAVIAEPGDDLSSIEIPSQDSAKEEQPKKEEPKKEEPKQEAPKEEESKPAKKPSAPVTGNKANPNQTLLPSVASIVKSQGLSREEALDKIPASGPNGRLLKGDVLAYFGSISQDSVTSLNNEIKKLSKLDLSNIKLRQPKDVPSAANDAAKGPKDGEAAKSAPKAREPLVFRSTISLTEINLLRATVESALDSDVSVKQLVEKAVKLAGKDVPVLARPKRSVLYDPVFESLITPSTRARPYTVEVKYEGASSLAAATEDIYDILGSSAKPLRRRVGGRAAPSPALVNVAVTVNESVPGAANKAQLFLDRLSYYLNSGKGDLIL